MSLLFFTCKVFSIRSLSMCSCLFHRHKWNTDKFQSYHHWSEKSARIFLDDLKTKLKIQSPHDWYRVTPFEIRQHGAGELLTQYKSLFTLLSTVYPEYRMSHHVALQGRINWSESLFAKKLPKYHWNKETAKKFMDDLRSKLNIQSPNDWHRVTAAEIRQHGGGGLYNKYRSLFKLLSNIYPEYPMNLMNYIALQSTDLLGLKAISQRTPTGIEQKQRNFWTI